MLVSPFNISNRLMSISTGHFSEVARFFLSMALKEGSRSQGIDVAFDTYKGAAIKNSERLARVEELRLELKKITVSQIVRRGESSSVMLETSQASSISLWKKPEYIHRQQGKLLFVTCGDRCYQITSNGSLEVVALKSIHEEMGGHAYVPAL